MYVIINLPITKGSTFCPSVLYQGGLPAVYIVLCWVLIIDSAAVFWEVWFSEVVLCLLDLGDFCEPELTDIF